MSRILVIEDKDELRCELVDLLELEGFEVVEARNGRLGLERFRATSPDLVICDLMMPEVDGYEMLKAMRGDPSAPGVPILVLTARTERPQVRLAMELGADDYITKPFDVGELLRAIRTALEKRARVQREADAKLDGLREQLAEALPHELRTPLACIMGYAEQLAEEGGDPGDASAIAQSILGAGQRLNRISDNALLYVQMELLRHGHGDVAALGTARTIRLDPIAASVARTKASAHRRETDLVLDPADVTVGMSETYVSKIVEELVDNAFKFSQPGTVVRVTTSSDGDRTWLRVADSGCGMSHEQVAAVGAFVQFERRAHEQQGLGLGLTIAKRVAMLWGGDVSIETEAGKGTIVTVSLPSHANATLPRVPPPRAPAT
jgi:two-component system, sensor histidine kinase and response regulator